MEWVGICVLALAVALALPVAAAGSLAAPSLGAHALLVLGALAACVLFLVLDGPRWPAWVSFGLSLAAAAALARGTEVLVSDEPRAASAGAEEEGALLAGVEWPMLLTAAFAMCLAAAGTTTVG
ncbi:MAG TPA: hypothetical protein VFT50_11850 [Baekduia sp.]|nr:hypothetical protein [Baekduia sp.]